MIKVMNATKSHTDVRDRISEIFVDGFFQWLKFFSKDKDVLTGAFAHMFNLDVFYVAEAEGQIVGIAALNDGTKQTVHLDKKELQKHLGWIKGTITYKVLKKEFEDKDYPFDFKSGMGYVEFVGTASNYRGRGVASAIIEHFFAIPGYNEYVLEVADTNKNAVMLYEKLGFTEFMRIEMKNKKQSGVNNLVYMRHLRGKFSQD